MSCVPACAEPFDPSLASHQCSKTFRITACAIKPAKGQCLHRYITAIEGSDATLLSAVGMVQEEKGSWQS